TDAGLRTDQEWPQERQADSVGNECHGRWCCAGRTFAAGWKRCRGAHPPGKFAPLAGRAAQTEAVVNCGHEVGYARELAERRRARWSIPLWWCLCTTIEGAVPPPPSQTAAGGSPS